MPSKPRCIMATAVAHPQDGFRQTAGVLDCKKQESVTNGECRRPAQRPVGFGQGDDILMTAVEWIGAGVDVLTVGCEDLR